MSSENVTIEEEVARHFEFHPAKHTRKPLSSSHIVDACTVRVRYYVPFRRGREGPAW